MCLPLSEHRPLNPPRIFFQNPSDILLHVHEDAMRKLKVILLL